jgi:hypothetical protein
MNHEEWNLVVASTIFITIFISSIFLNPKNRGSISLNLT